MHGPYLKILVYLRLRKQETTGQSCLLGPAPRFSAGLKEAHSLYPFLDRSQVVIQQNHGWKWKQGSGRREQSRAARQRESIRNFFTPLRVLSIAGLLHVGLLLWYKREDTWVSPRWRACDFTPLKVDSFKWCKRFQIEDTGSEKTRSMQVNPSIGNSEPLHLLNSL